MVPRNTFSHFPELTLRNEDVPTIDADQNVGLTLVVESFPGGLPLERTIQLYEKVGSQILFPHPVKGLWAEFHDLHHVFHDAEDLLVVFA